MTPLRKMGIVAIAGLLGIWGTGALGFWQLRRAAAKEVLQQQIDAAARAEPTPPGAHAFDDPASLVHRHVRLRGRWLPDRVVYLDNRPQAGQAGFYVLMALRVDTPASADVIVNRGWTPRNMQDRTRIEPYRTPAGTVDITGVVLAEEPRLLDLAQAPDRPLQGIWQNFDFDAYAKASGQAALPVVVRQDTDLDAATPVDGLLRDWPDRGGALQAQIDRHHGYAFQWFALAATLGALLLFQLLRVIRHGRPSLQQ
jgi:surfeit locus 1 family protein